MGQGRLIYELQDDCPVSLRMIDGQCTKVTRTIAGAGLRCYFLHVNERKQTVVLTPVGDADTELSVPQEMWDRWVRLP